MVVPLFAAFRDYADNIKRYIRTGSYTSGLTANTKRAIRKATSSGQYSLEGRLNFTSCLIHWLRPYPLSQLENHYLFVSFAIGTDDVLDRQPGQENICVAQLGKGDAQ